MIDTFIASAATETIHVNLAPGDVGNINALVVRTLTGYGTTVLANAAGIAMAPGFTANHTAGSFTVQVANAVDGLSGSLQLTNLPGPAAIQAAGIGNGTHRRHPRPHPDRPGLGNVEHTLEELLKQRIFGLCLGYEDLNDHDQLRHDPLLAVLVGQKDPLGNERLGRNKGKDLAGKSTLNRLELTPVRANADSRYKKIVAHLDAMPQFLVQVFVQQYVVPPTRIVLDVDATDFALHGHQLGRFFHGYYDEHCYLPLYIFCGDHPLLPCCGRPTLTSRSGCSSICNASSRMCGNIGRTCTSWCVATAVSAANR